MPNGDKPTVDEHYVPQVYLQGFATDNNSERIYRLSLSHISAGCTNVKIKSQSFEKNLYEIIDSAGNFIGRNYIEESLHNEETLYGKFRSMLFAEIESCRNSGQPAYLSEEIRTFLTNFILLQMVRTKKVVKSSLTKAVGDLKEYAQPYEVAIQTFFKLFPFFDKNIVSSFVGPSMVDIMTPWLNNMIFFVGYFSNDVLFTSDNPVYALMENYDIKEPGEILYPISPRSVVVLAHRDKIGAEYNNQILQLSDEWAEHIRECSIIGANDTLYAPHEFDLNYLKEIERIRNRENI